MKEIGHEEAIHVKADHRFPEGGRKWLADKGTEPAARFLSSELLPLAQQVWRHECVRCETAEGA